jgi:uncharacterized membrane protein YgcG
MMRRITCAIVLLLLTAGLAADERILAFDSEIDIQADASLLITESIRVRAEGNQIRRGIYRDFPTRYRDRGGNRYRTTFNVLRVLRDGQSEPFHTQRIGNGVRLYIGSSDTHLAPGEYLYQLHYRTTRQLGFFDEFDELYWNVTGNGWAFPIDQASATITLPEPVAIKDLQVAVYTGAQGASGQDADWRTPGSKQVHFETTRSLAPREGLTVAVGWPKGLVAEPGALQRIGWFLTDNLGALALLLGFLVTLAWYLWAWNLKGRDPAKGVIFPRFKPPQGLTPAACCYVLDMGLRAAAFTAAVISLGVKGYLRIDEQDKDFTLYREAGSPRERASEGEKAVLEALLPQGSTSIELDDKNHSEFGSAHSGLGAALAKEYKGRLFNLNIIYALPAFLASIVAGIAAIVFGATPFLFFFYVPLVMVMHALFVFLLRAPTPAGRHVMDEIEGFRMYLGTAERDRLGLMKSPALTPEVFEMFLPYAFALGVENGWCKRFEREFPQLHEGEGAYQPGWYSGRLSGASAMSHISSGLSGGLSNAISSASSPPGSSSGSGGGGSSGGGGGGGGGGGW